jgi:NAD(P)-dependent dehydrogenase (short-subunit alcohol dehydrogenase family)
MRVLITGANRGIGFELLKRYLGRGDRVVATYREAARSGELLEMAKGMPDQLMALRLDVRYEASIDAAYREALKFLDGLDLLINNAGMGDNSADLGNPEAHKALGLLRSDAILGMLAVNSVAPIMVTQTFLPLLQRGKDAKVVHMSSKMGSIGLRGDSGYYSYSASKTALNMLGRVLSSDLIKMGVVSAMLHPGWVKTAMGGSEAPVPLEESVDGLVRVIDGLTMADNGRFMDYTGQEIPW